MKCIDCKYWDNPRKDPYSDYLPKEINECFKAKVLWDCKELINDGEYTNYKIKDEFKDLKLFVQDGSDYRVIMLTKADFFCAHFEQLDK